MADDGIPTKLASALISLLSSVRKEEDIQQIHRAGITEACFVGAPQHWEALQYITSRIRKGKKISKAYLKRVHEVVLIHGADAPKLYADEIVLATARAQADRIIADLDEANFDTVKSEEFYESARKARNLLRDLASPSTNGYQVLAGRSTIYMKTDSMEMPPPQKWIVQGYVPDGCRTFFYGRGGSGKSGLAVLLALCVATGKPFLDVPVNKGAVLYIDWEAGEETFRATVNRLAGPLGVDLSKGVPNLRYKRLYGPLNEYLDDIIEEVEDEGIVLVVMDSFGFSMSGMDTTKQPDVTAQMARLAKIPGATLIIDHIGKQGKGEDGPFGSVYKHAAARWMWWLQAAVGERCPDGEVKKGTFIRLSNTKHNIAAKQDDVFLHIQWNDPFNATSMAVDKVAKDKVPESLAGTIKDTVEQELSPTQQEFLDHVREHYIETHEAISKDAMMTALQVTAKTVGKEAESLKDLGLIRYSRLPKNAKLGGSPRGYMLTGDVQGSDTTEAEASL